MRLATFNVENLFERPVAMNQANWAVGKAALAAYSDFNSIIGESVYSDAIKTKVLQDLKNLELLKENRQGALRLASSSRYAILRENRGHLPQRVREIYDALNSNNDKNVAIIGDFNDSPNSGLLDPLLRNGSNLLDIFQYGNIQNGGIPGTFGSGNPSDKLDYMLLSPTLWGKVTDAGVFRKGVWDGRKTKKWQMYPNMSGPENGASDHALVWADINI